MKSLHRGVVSSLAALAVGVCVAGVAATELGYGVARPEETMPTQRARGEFDVKLVPQAQDEDTGLGRLSIDKTFRGDLVGKSRGEMLTAMTGVEGSAGYVAVERVTGTLGGRKGSFALQHDGLMDRGKPSLSIRVVPDSGTGELAGLAGTMTIEIKDGKHFYELEYTLAKER
jgi:hypothetical protein